LVVVAVLLLHHETDYLVDQEVAAKLVVLHQQIV
jgi:hypothetical protein